MSLARAQKARAAPSSRGLARRRCGKFESANLRDGLGGEVGSNLQRRRPEDARSGSSERDRGPFARGSARRVRVRRRRRSEQRTWPCCARRAAKTFRLSVERVCPIRRRDPIPHENIPRSGPVHGQVLILLRGDISRVKGNPPCYSAPDSPSKSPEERSRLRSEPPKASRCLLRASRAGKSSARESRPPATRPPFQSSPANPVSKAPFLIKVSFHPPDTLDSFLAALEPSPSIAIFA